MPDEIENFDDLSESRFGKIPIEVTISIGMARPPIRDLLALENDAILPLDRALDDPVELFVGNSLIGRGQLEELEEGSGRLGVRITEITALNEVL